MRCGPAGLLSPEARCSLHLEHCCGLPESDIAAPTCPAGNDFSTLYAPLIRDGRMEKFYWAPSREDRIGVCMGIFQHDGVDK